MVWPAPWGAGCEPDPLRRQCCGHRDGGPHPEGANRKKAIIWGAAGAVVLRLLFAAVITLLLEVPLLQVVGGLLLVWIAWKLIHEGDGEGDEEKVKAGSSTWQAVRIIIVADAVMSLDNVIALVQAARIGGRSTSRYSSSGWRQRYRW